MGKGTPLLRRVRFVAAALAVSACGDKVCTLLPTCNAGLIVHLATRPTVPFRVELTVPNVVGTGVYVYDCPNPTVCTQDPWFANFFPDRVSVRVTTAAGSVVKNDVIPDWYTAHPNGPGCDPTCRQATIGADVPQ